MYFLFILLHESDLVFLRVKIKLSGLGSFALFATVENYCVSLKSCSSVQNVLFYIICDIHLMQLRLNCSLWATSGCTMLSLL